MYQATDVLLSVRRMLKLYEKHLKPVCEAWNLTLMEANIISFLHNNPGKDTAGDIADIRMLPKGNVSQGVESLIQKSLLTRSQDENDRRKIHLSLTEKALPIIGEIKKARARFLEQTFSGLSGEEYEQYVRLSRKIMENTKRSLENR